MNQTSTLSALNSAQNERANIPQPSSEPWLFLSAPLSFVLTLIVVCWISLQSF